MFFFELEKEDVKIGPIQRCIRFLNCEMLPEVGKSMEIGDGICCIVNSYRTIQEEDAIWEAHRKYVDVHCVLSGKEKIGVAYIDECKTGAYHAEQDYLEVRNVNSEFVSARIMLKKGTALCLFPNDAHQVKVRIDSDKELDVKKVVFKIPVELF